MIKKVIVSVIAIVCLVSFGYVDSQAADEPKPRVVIQKPRASSPLNIYMFYDTQANIICYVTSTGQALDCIPLGQLSSPVIRRLKKLVENYEKMNPDREVPNIITIPGN